MIYEEPREFATPFTRRRIRAKARRRIENLPPSAEPVIAPAWPEGHIERHRPRLTALFLGITRNGHDAEELFPELWIKLRGMEEPDDPDGYLFQSARNLAIDRLRARESEAARHQARGEAGMVPVDLSQASGRDAARWLGRDADDAQADDRRERLHAAIARLPEKDREILVDHRLEGRPVKEIAAKDGVTGQAIYKRLEKALAKLLAILL